ncbi:MAG: GNAT family N-acetyltransferase [Massilia sp.]
MDVDVMRIGFLQESLILRGGISMSDLRRTVSCYENEIPSFVEHELDRLYGERYSSLAHFHIYGTAERASTYVVRVGGEITTVLLYRRANQTVHVLNEGAAIDGRQAQEFADHVFAADAAAAAIVFEAVQTQTDDIRFPYQHFPCAEDTVLTLPDSVAGYTDSLGKSTRDNLKRYLSRVRRDFPSFHYATYDRQEANEQHIREIVRLNYGRMTTKNKIPSIDKVEEARIIETVRACGFVGIATVNGRFGAGFVTYRHGDSFSLRILAHDPAFDDYRLGLACCYLTICECIKQAGSKKINFGWGEYAYKYRLGGVRRQLSRLVIYRSRLGMLSCAPLAAKTVVRGHVYRAKQGMQAIAQQEDHVLARPIGKMVGVIRWLKAARARQGAGRSAPAP